MTFERVGSLIAGYVIVRKHRGSMKDNQPAEKYRRYVGGIGTWLPIVCGLVMSINAAAVDFSLKAVIL